MALQEELEQRGNFLFKHRSYFPLLFLTVGVLVFYLTKKSFLTYQNFMDEERYRLCCLAVCAAGLFIRIYTVGYTPANTSGRNVYAGQPADQLNTTGIYSIIRHPLHVGNFFIWLGIALLTENLWLIFHFIVLFWIYYGWVMLTEERFLRDKYGLFFLDWADRTPAIWPNFGRYKNPSLQFSTINVLKMEKNSLCNLCLVFFLFDAIDSLMENGRVIPNSWEFYLALFGVIIYLSIKLLGNLVKTISRFHDEIL